MRAARRQAGTAAATAAAGGRRWWLTHLHEDRYGVGCVAAYEVDLEARTARVSIPGVLESVGRPIEGATGQEYRVRIEIPKGIEFERAEMGSATTTSTGAITLDLHDTYGQFNMLRHSQRGVVHS